MVGPWPHRPFTFRALAKTYGQMWLRCDVCRRYARLKLGDAPDGRYRLIVLDAFSGDSIPMHLLTREAVRLYLRKLAPGGIIAFHITNQHLDLASVLGNLAQVFYPLFFERGNFTL